jgi:hypothetical protein
VGLLGARQSGADQLAVRKAFLVGGLYGWHGLESFFQSAPPANRPQQQTAARAAGRTE